MTPTIRPAPLAAAALATVVLAAPARGQAPDPAAGPARDAVTESADTFDLPGLVVTATRVPLSRDALPTPVTVITGRELELRGVRSVADALRQVPGAAVVQAGPTGAQTSLFLRGGESDYVKILVDGVPVNDAGGSFDLANLSTDQVERIEVVRGPVSVLYGSDAVSGVVQVFTRRGTGSPTVTVEATGGLGERRHGDDRYGTWDVDAAVTGSTGSVSYALGGSRAASDGLYPLNNERVTSTASLRLGWTPASDADLSLSTRLTDGRSHFPTDGAGALVDENAYLDRRLWTTSLQGGWRLHDRVDARVQLGLVARRQSAIDRPDGPGDTEGVYASTLDYDGTRRLADARLNVRLPRTTLTAGVAWEDAEASTAYTSASAFGPLDAAADYDRATTGYYLQLLSAPVDRLHLTVGGRLDDSETYGTFETFRLGAALQLAEGTRVRGAIGRGFREPTFAESFGSGFGDLGNPDLEPERSRSWEAGMEQDVGQATLSATWFDQEFDDLVQYTYSPPADGDPNYFNVGAARARGLELEARLSGAVWSGWASYTRLETEVLDPGLATDAVFAEGAELLRRPAHAGSLGGRLSLDRVALSAAVDLVGAREDVDYGAGFPAPRVTLPGYTTLDLSGEYTLPVGGPATTLLLRVENLLDTDYEAIAGFPARGRLLQLGARVQTR